MSAPKPYEKNCDRCGKRIRMVNVEGKWYARNPEDSSNHFCEAKPLPPQSPPLFRFPPEQEAAVRRIAREEVETAIKKVFGE